MKNKIIFFIILIVLIFSIKEFLNIQAKNDKILNTPYVLGYLNKKEKLLSLQNKHNYKIVMIGDSITAGTNWNEIFKKDDILNMGQGSDFTYIKKGKYKLGVVNRLDGLDSKYQKAFIMLGFNDFNSGRKPDEVFKSYIEIIKIIKNKKITPIIQSTLFITENKYKFDVININKNITKLNKLLVEYSKSNNIKFIDVNRYLSIKNELDSKYTYDGVHLNEYGYEVWASTIEIYIMEGK